MSIPTQPTSELRIVGLAGLPEVKPGDDLPLLIGDAIEASATGLEAGDVLVVTQKIVSKAEGRLVYQGETSDANGYFIPPTIFADVPETAKIACEEIFGPVLAIVKANDFEDALRIANDSEYGLTGSVYSRNRAVLEQARTEFDVGNLYLNRKCTGAMVGVHPFAGIKLSGTNSKAGGPDYLFNFVEAKAVGEKL